MGAILGIAGGVVLLVLVAILWSTGAFRPKSKDAAGASAPASTKEPKKRTGSLD